MFLCLILNHNASITIPHSVFLLYIKFLFDHFERYNFSVLIEQAIQLTLSNLENPAFSSPNLVI